MGTMEKAGIAVIAVLIGIIVVVGMMNKKGANDAVDSGKKIVKEESAKTDAHPSPNVLGGGTAEHPLVNGNDPKKPDANDKPQNGGENDNGKKVVIEEDPSVAPENAALAGFPKSYKVKKDETLTKIAFREYGVSKMEKFIKETNNLDAKAIKEGMTITLPMPPAELRADVVAALTKTGETLPGKDSNSNVAKEPTGGAKPVAGGSKKAQPGGKTATKASGRPSFISPAYIANNLKSSKAATKPSGKSTTTKKK